MADLTAFHPTLHPWLTAVWRDRVRILAAARQEGQTEGAWQVYDRYNDPTAAATDDFATFCQELFYLTTDFPVECAGQQSGDATDFFHLEPPGCVVAQGKARVYVHTPQPVQVHAIAVARAVLGLMQVNADIVKLKVAGPGLSPARGDTVVIWLKHEFAVKWLLVRLKDPGVAAHCHGPVPPGVRPVADGLGWSLEPPRTDGDEPMAKNLTALWQSHDHSFGTYLAGCIFLALATCGPRGDKFLDAVLRYFRAAGVDPMNPHRVTMADSEARHRALITSLALILDGGSAGDLIAGAAIGADPTSPFRPAPRRRAERSRAGDLITTGD